MHATRGPTPGVGVVVQLSDYPGTAANSAASHRAPGHVCSLSVPPGRQLDSSYQHMVVATGCAPRHEPTRMSAWQANVRTEYGIELLHQAGGDAAAFRHSLCVLRVYCDLLTQ